MKTSSCGLESFTSASAADSTALALFAHAAAVIDDQPQRHGNVFALEQLDLLQDAVLENLKRALRQVGDQVPALIGNRHIQRNQPRLGGKDRVFASASRAFGVAGWLCWPDMKSGASIAKPPRPKLR